MNRPAFTACIILSTALGALPFGSASAGGAISKCVDGAGRVTLTDQPCDGHTVRSTVVVAATASDDTVPDNAPLATEAPARPTAAGLPLRQARWVPSPVPRGALAGDMATLKQARVQLMLQDTAPRARLASLDR